MRPDPADPGSVTPVPTVLAEDGVLLREGLVGVLERFGFPVVAAVGDGEALVGAVAKHRPGLVVTDIRMPPDLTDEGLRAAVRLRRRDPGLAVVALSQYVELSYASDLLDSGNGRGVGYLLKQRVGDVREFASVLRQVVGGATVVDPEVVRQLLRRSADPLDRLTPRERQVLGLMAEGHSNGAIARRLTVSDAAVGKHIGNILAKLDLPPDEEVHRRVRAVLAHLRGRGDWGRRTGVGPDPL
ncbi:response regulator transcription factor [Nocardiopsis sp. EMB25]|uniref:response regulator n=1 Tax=Nocardiopsis sp. EMB25 TaxID=2835867 RepID=UPI0022836761|nr:response regulator transcription factor [Nocardiopsis sp. EMB25]MCY9783972.1 response regulator transcription factor [Nocardiopsis sp. EMB25]